MAKTPTNTKASPDQPEGEGTKLAQVENPAKLKDSEIKEISGDDGSDDPENAANADAADAMKQDRHDAKTKGDDDENGERTYFGGQGGAGGI
jgi:hypothetical protein